MNLKGRGNENFMSLLLSRNVDGLHLYIYLSFMVIINEYNFKDSAFTNYSLLVCFLTYLYLPNTFSKFDHFSSQTLNGL